MKDGLHEKYKGKQTKYETIPSLREFNPEDQNVFFNTILTSPDAEPFRTPSRKKKMKVIVTGGIVEVWEFEKGIMTDKKIQGVEREKEYTENGLTIDAETGEVIYDREKAKTYYANRSRWEVIRLIRNNFDNTSKFVTLTFRDGSVSNVKDVDECNEAFHKFIMRMRKEYTNLKYVRVTEFQDEYKRGAVHYHMICDLPYIRFEKLADKWGLGFIGVNRIDQVDDLGAYMTKYLSKSFNDPRLNGKKNYTSSHNLNRPVPLYGGEAAGIVEEFLKGKKPVMQRQYSGGEYVGEIKYWQYNMNRK